MLRADRLPGVVTQFHRGDLEIRARGDAGPPVVDGAGHRDRHRRHPRCARHAERRRACSPRQIGGGSRLELSTPPSRCSIPLVGGKIENFIGSQLVELLIAEQRFTTVWITENALNPQVQLRPCRVAWTTPSTFDAPAEKIYRTSPAGEYWEDLIAILRRLTPRAEITQFSSGRAAAPTSSFTHNLPRMYLPPIAAAGGARSTSIITREQHFDPFDPTPPIGERALPRADPARPRWTSAASTSSPRPTTGSQMRLVSVCKVTGPAHRRRRSSS